MSVSVYDPVPDIGYLYDHVPLYEARQDAAFYLEEARRSPGEVLEIGCGTGRVLLPIARAGVRITGLDASRQMLERLRQRLAAEPAEVRGRVTVVEADATAFDLGRTFPLITAPFRVFQHMVTVDSQMALLKAVAKHLAPGGRFIFDLFNPRYDLLAMDRSRIAIDTPRITLPDGRTLERGARIAKVRWLDQVSEVEMVWYLSDGAGTPVREYVQPFEMRWFTRSEIEHLVARMGFRVEAVFGDLTRGPLVDGAPEQVYTLTRA